LVTMMTLITMLVMNWRLTVILVPLGPIFLLLRHRYRTLQRHTSDVVRANQGRVTSLLQEYLAAVAQVQLLTRDLAVARRFVRIAEEFIRSQSVLRKNSQEFSMLSLSVIALGVSIILSYGGYQVISGELTAGGLIAFYSYLMRLFEPMNN